MRNVLFNRVFWIRVKRGSLIEKRGRISKTDHR